MSGSLVLEMQRIVSLEESKLKTKKSFDYERAFCRNIGLFSVEEQQKLKNSKIAFSGIGGMGGSYVQSMARTGIGNFVLADGDEFNVVNFNRQAGASMDSVGKNKAETLKEFVLDINPEAKVDLYPHLDEKNIDAFLDGVDLVINGIEAFAPDAYRMLYRKAREKGIAVITGAPLSFGTAWVMFGPDQSDMSADKYFDWRDSQTDFEKIANFLNGLAPKGFHLRDMDLKHVDLDKHIAPSNICGVMIGTGLVSIEAYRYLLNWEGKRYAPHFTQFDARRNQLVAGKLRWGNRGPWQSFKRAIILRKYKQAHQAQ